MSGHLLKDLSFNSVAMIARLFSGVVLFVLMGRWMGATRFGEFTYAMTLASVLSLPASLGFGAQVLREVGAHPEDAREIVRKLTGAKVLLATLVMVGGAGYVLADIESRVVFAALLSVALFDSFSEYLFCVLRARGRYGLEAKVAVLSSAVHFGLVVGVLQYSTLPLAAALAFMASRGLLLGVAIVTVKGTIGFDGFSKDLREILRELKRSAFYSVDACLTVLVTQVDTLLIKWLAGATEVGIYQAGMRIVLGMQHFTGVAANVFVPRLANAHSRSKDYVAVAKAAVSVFIGLGLGFALLLLVTGSPLVKYGYGPEFSGLLPLLPFLAALILARFCASAFGIQLTAIGAQATRTWVNAAALVVIVVSCVGFYALGGLKGFVLALVLSAGLVCLAYFALLAARVNLRGVIGKG
jgi:O-antigen/teichoic acid export membrane protein